VQERAVNLEHYGQKYDEVHEKVSKNAPKAMREWNNQRGKFEVSLAKTEHIVMAAPMRGELNELINDVDKWIAEIKATSHIMEVRGKGHLSIHDLESCQTKCEECFTTAKQGTEITNLLDKLPNIGRKGRKHG